MAIRGLVECALLAALTAVLALIGIFILPLSLITNLVWTIPIVVAIVRHGWQSGALALAVATLLIAMLAGIPSALILLLQFGGLAIVYGNAFRKSWSTLRAMLIGTVVTAISTVAVFWVSLALAGLTPAAMIAQFNSSLNETIEFSIEFYRRYGLLDRLAEQGLSEEGIRSQVDAMVNLFKVLLPSLFIVYSGATAATNLLVSRAIVKKLHLPVTLLAPFREWRLPWHVVWGFIVGLAAMLAGDYWKINWLGTIGVNVLYAYFPILLVLGSSVLAYFLHRFSPSPFMKTVLALLGLMFFNLSLLFIAGIGLFDLVFNYRAMLDRVQRP